MKQVEASGRSVEEAIGRARASLGVTHADVDVEVLDPGSRGMFGLGAREARVRLTLKAGPAAVAQQLTERLLQAMGFAGTVQVHERNDAVSVEIRGQNLGALIGRRGATLEAIELLLGLMVARQVETRTRILLDVEGYRERRQRVLEDLARRIASQVQREGREVALEPMEGKERRVIHTTLADHLHVYTFSRGEGPMRRVVIAPRHGVDAGTQAQDEPVGT